MWLLDSNVKSFSPKRGEINTAPAFWRRRLWGVEGRGRSGRNQRRGLSVDRVRIGEDDGTCNLLVQFRSCEVGCRGCDTW